MTKNQKIAISVLVFSVVLGAGVYGIGMAKAQGWRNSDSFVDRLATRFNLNKTEVSDFFNQERRERQKTISQRRQQNLEERLTAAVSAGELTQAQKQLIIDKMASLEKEREVNREAHQNLSFEERQKEMMAHRAEIEKWASDNGIDVKYLLGGGFGRGMNGKGFGNGRVNNTK